MVGALRLDNAVDYRMSLKWSDWVHANNVVRRRLDSGFEVTSPREGGARGVYQDPPVRFMGC